MRALLLLIVVINYSCIKAQTYELRSPDKNIELTVDIKESISFNVSYNNKSIIENSNIGLNIDDQKIPGASPKVKKIKETQNNTILNPVITQKSAKINDEYNELIISFKGNYQLSFRAYNDGVAYRFSTSLKRDVIVKQEIFNLNFSDETFSLFPKENSLISHYERVYIPTNLDTLNESTFCSLPVFMKIKNINVLLTEADVFDYPGMFMYGTKGNSLNAGFPNYVNDAKPSQRGADRNEILTSADFIAKTSGTRNYPWRIMVITDKDKELILNNLVYQLSRPLEIEDPQWIKPGKVAWDWYNANNIYGVDFESGINTDTYKYYIDFAAQHGLEYIILDEGWSKTTTNIREFNPDIDVKELIEYGNKKNVGVILWVLWGPLDKDIDVLELYSSWGVKGVKVDFMQRADQYMVNYYERVAKAAAKQHLIVDFHGSFKPSGLRRAYPNVLTYEGLKGNENNKWSKLITPEHNLTLPFIRMVAGPMDFTPGSMINATKNNHQISWERPMSLGTRCHQVAMYVVFESPLQMLCESPSTYYKEEETSTFISKIPTVWDETIVLEAKVSDYVLIARRKGDKWYIGAMTDWSSREFEIDFSFLKEGSYSMEIMRDGDNTDRFAQDYKYEVVEINQTSLKKIKLASGGGWAAIISKK